MESIGKTNRYGDNLGGMTSGGHESRVSRRGGLLSRRVWFEGPDRITEVKVFGVPVYRRMEENYLLSRDRQGTILGSRVLRGADLSYLDTDVLLPKTPEQKELIQSFFAQYPRLNGLDEAENFP